MRIFLLDTQIESRQLLLGRIQEALRRVQLKRVEIVEGDLEILREHAGNPPAVGILGPGCYEDLENSVSRFRTFFPKTPIAVVLDNNVYASEALELRKFLSARILPIADIAQMAQLILDTVGSAPGNNEGPKLETAVVGVIHVKGGAGCSTIAGALAACWAQNDRSVALVDLDDVNPLISDWSLATIAKRRTISELLLEGEVPKNRTVELLAPVPNYQNLFVVPQPILYGESFHFKADVIDGAPSSATFIPSLVSALETELDLVVLDLGNSWGVSTFAALRLCKYVLFVFDEDKTSLKRSLETLRRFYRESDDPTEFDFNRWRFIQNASTQTLIKLEQATDFINLAELRSEPFDLSEIKFSISGRDWYLSSESGSPLTLYELAETKTRNQITEIANSILPFQEKDLTASSKGASKGIKERLKQVVSFLS